MWIKRLEVTHFQKHEHLILDFTNEVNVLYGATDTGKSCIRRAVEWVVFNQTLKNDGIRQENSKQTSVKITRENETIVERIKSNSINRYLLTKDGKTEVFDSIGKTIPEPIKDALGVSTIEVDGEEIILNISKQVALPFLLDKSGTFRMKLFNKITGNDIVDEVLQSFNKDILGISKKEKLQEEILINRKEEKKNIDKILTQQKNIYAEYKDKFDVIILKVGKLDKLTKVFEKLNNIKEEKNKIVLKDVPNISNNKILSIKNNIAKWGILSKSSEKITMVMRDKNTVTKWLSELKLPKLNLKNIDLSIIKFEKLLNFKLKIKELNSRKKQLTEDLKESETLKNDWIKKYKELLLKYGKCPTCKRVLDSKKISEIEL